MATAAARAMSSAEPHRKFSNPRHSIKVADIRTTNVHRRYESEEEEISEAEASGRTESVFSPVENDSDTGLSESEEMSFDSPQAGAARERYTSEDKFAFRIPTSPTTEAPILRAGSTSTVNRASCITVMPPLQPQPTKAVSMGSSTSTSTSKATEPIFSTSHVTEEEALQYFRSFYADTLPSDDEDVADISFLIATPISFYAPESKPHLISIEPPATQTWNGRTTENQMRPEPVPMTNQASSKTSPSNASIKSRISGFKMGKYGKRRSSTQPISESKFPTYTKLSNASVHSLSNPSWRSSSALSFSESELHSSTTSRESRNVTSSAHRRHTLLPSPRLPDQRSIDNRRQTIERNAANNVKLEGNTGRTEDRRASKAKKKHNIPPVPQITGIAISSNVSSPTSTASSPDSPRPTPLRDQRLAPKPPFLKHGTSRRGINDVKDFLNSSPSSINAMDRSTNFPFPDIPSSRPLHATTKRRGFHERTQSINSLASTTSVPNFGSPDNTSPRSATHRYRQRFYPADAFTSERPPSRESVNPSLKPNPRNTYTFAPRGSVSTTNLSYLSSTSTVAPRSNSRSDVNNMSWNYRTGTWSPSGAPETDSVKTPLRKQAHSKSIKRLYETSESVSRVGTKAFNGLGSILRKKHVASGDERWNSNRVV